MSDSVSRDVTGMPVFRSGALDPQVDLEFDSVWRDIVQPHGIVDLDQIKKELFDYSRLMRDVSVAYDGVTMGRISKPNTDPSEVIAEVEARIERECENTMSAHPPTEGNGD